MTNETTPAVELPEASLASLSKAIQDAAGRAGWPQLMPVQARAIPYLLAGKDMMIQSRTGSGKTGGFLLPIIHQLQGSRPGCRALILVPTRELALQVSREAEILAGPDGPGVIAVYGGTSYGPQIDAFKRGAQIVVGTPGRILDHLIKRSLSLDGLTNLVFDEADRMLSMGFYPDMRKIGTYMPRSHYQVWMFSATFPPYVQRLANQFMQDPETLSLSHDVVHVAETEHLYYEVPAMDKDRCLVRLIEAENPTSAIIFCNTKQRVEYVSSVLKRFGYDADPLSADLNQKQRERVLERVRQGTLRFLVATDVAGRGIDIPEISHVFQYEPPEDPEAYIHRSGRTGRAGAAGTAITLVSEFEEMDLMRIAKRYKIPIERTAMPDNEEIARIVSQRALALLEGQLRERDSLQTERMGRFTGFVGELAASAEGLKLITMLIDDYYQEKLHAATPQAVDAAEAAKAAAAAARPAPRRDDDFGSSKPRGGGGGGHSRRRPRR